MYTRARLLFDVEIRQIVSGGQTGVDRAALDAALARGIDIAGWCPKGRLAEDGPVAARYGLVETPLAAQGQRTRWNVRDSDGTLVIKGGQSPGTKLAREAAALFGKPLLILDVERPDARRELRAWLARNGIRVLNVAGPRESESPGIYACARRFLVWALG